ncbi:cation:dicarboxylase symporter family transporter [Paraburkholderia phymatum]|uniref:Sodium:dicarboxylate symporter n=1 Tax=Paraburkholderia phymatum (strain DSM 17167 / CIP 108236 / LMG 21445 / STM815) TaxID=391038 RepID=B2JVS8_PARP8|nr:cation:dicarboxylase symporter family transporter [Paraburkholderia phymatum]ACC75055.1 sodium:dicarboxylate symporter [Paraburkholderia phymatum STM815]
MRTLRTLSQSTLGLIACLALGGLCGMFAGPVGEFAYFIGQLYLSVVNMAAIPLLVVATFFGLRQVIALPMPRTRVGTIVALAFASVVISAIVGTLTGLLVMPGEHLPASAHAQLGELVLKSGSDADEVRVTMFDRAVGTSDTANRVLSIVDIFPDNFYRALAEGRSLGILTGTLLFGMAFAALSREQTKMLSNVFEGVYRSLETIIAHANLLIPVLVLGVAANLTSHTQSATLDAMSSLLLCFAASTSLLAAVAIGTIATRAGQPFFRVLGSLKAPLLIGLTSGSATAPIPHTIEAMSERLGFSRGVVELVVPFGSVFVRAGSALYYTLATVFVANLYERPLGVGEMTAICAASVIAAFISAGQNGVATVGYTGLVLSLLNLPVEAAGVLLVTVDLICEGPRNVLSLLSVCTVIALVSAGLPSERVATVEPRGLAELNSVLRFTFTRGQLLLAVSCVVVAASLIVLMGIGVGAR